MSRQAAGDDQAKPLQARHTHGVAALNIKRFESIALGNAVKARSAGNGSVGLLVCVENLRGVAGMLIQHIGLGPVHASMVDHRSVNRPWLKGRRAAVDTLFVVQLYIPDAIHSMGGVA
jgi:hypothetical protein